MRYQHRYEEGYDIPDVRYRMWRSMYHPEFNSDACQQLPPNLHEVSHGQPPLVFHPPQTILSKVLGSTTPVYKLPGREPKNSARVLTSSVNLQLILDKKRQKDEAEKKSNGRLQRGSTKTESCGEAEKTAAEISKRGS